MRRLQNCVLTFLRPQNSPIEPQKAQNDPKISQHKKRQKIKGYSEIKSWYNIFMSRPQNSLLIPPPTPISTTQSQKAQNDLKIGQD